MMTFLELENYRGFKRYALRGLSRVNLLVGMNNCGKTSVLEAIHLLASGGDPQVFFDIASRRGEIAVVAEQERRFTHVPDVSHFFHGHEFAPGVSFRVRSDRFGSVGVRVLSPENEPSLFNIVDIRAPLGLQIEIRERGGNRDLVLGTSEEGAILFDPRRRLLPHPARDHNGSPSLQFLSPDSLEPGSISEMWDHVVLEGREPRVVDALRILEPELANIAFLSGDRRLAFGGRGAVVLGFKGQKRRVPLGSQGDGMRRMLMLALSLICNEGGVLLIDEIDTGLHYSIMGDMWLLVAKAARQANVQVFATTHSLDCLTGLRWLIENHPELKGDVSVQKVHRSLDEAVALDADQIDIAVEQGIEVR